MKFSLRILSLVLLIALLASCQITINPALPTATPLPLATMTPAPSPTPPEATATPLPPTATPPEATATPAPPTATQPSATNTPVAATPTPLATPQAYDFQDQPERLITSYANAISRQDYHRAYDYWESAPQTFADFAAGFADTASVLAVIRVPNIIDGAAGSQYAAIPTLLLATHTDGARQVFRACYVVRRTNPEMTGSPEPWRIYNAAVSVAARPNAWQLEHLCDDYGPHTVDLTYDETDTPLHLIGAYANAINQHAYHRAYDYWETNPQSYADFVAGFSNTDFVMAVTLPPAWIEGAAGSSYAQVRTMLLARHTDGSHHPFRACYVTRKSNVTPAEPWQIYDATASVAPSANAWQLIQVCP